MHHKQEVSNNGYGKHEKEYSYQKARNNEMGSSSEEPNGKSTSQKRPASVRAHPVRWRGSAIDSTTENRFAEHGSKRGQRRGHLDIS
jgi:hypothetical protein